MKIKTSELIGAALDWAVLEACRPYLTDPGMARISEFGPLFGKGYFYPSWGSKKYSPSTDWKEGGPIIEQENISLDQREGEPCRAYIYLNACEHLHAMFAPERQPLIAAMRCFVASNLGDEVDIPEILL